MQRRRPNNDFFSPRALDFGESVMSLRSVGDARLDFEPVALVLQWHLPCRALAPPSEGCRTCLEIQMLGAGGALGSAHPVPRSAPPDGL